MSDSTTVTAPIPEPTPSVTVATVEAAVSTNSVDFRNPEQLLMYAMKVIGQVEVLSDLSDADKAAMIINAVKASINSSSLTESEKVTALGWCDDALPHVIQAVAIVKADLKKVEAVMVADIKSCCLGFFAKKV